jgi:2-dehydro-3-deoxygalactonokinase
MADSPSGWAVALDGGTTNTRARLVAAATGRIHCTARRTVGVRDTVLTAERGDSPLARAVRDALAEVSTSAGGILPDLIVAAGMLSSEVGLTAVPHVLAPAGLDELAQSAVRRHLPTITERPIIFIPGVRTPAAEGPDGWASADVMRGEECETLGAALILAELEPSSAQGVRSQVFLWPGSHTKLVEVDAAGRIVRSHTTLAGELTFALARHTLLAASLPEELPDDPEPEAIAAGARLAVGEGLGRAAFLVRIAALCGSLPARERAAFWLGAVVGDDAAHLVRHPILQDSPIVWVGGRQPLRDLYAAQLGRRTRSTVRVLGDATVERASAVGALAVARRFTETPGAGASDAAGPGVTG